MRRQLLRSFRSSCILGLVAAVAVSMTGAPAAFAGAVPIPAAASVAAASVAAALAGPSAAGGVVSVTPARIADSRTNQQITGAVPALGTVPVQVTGQGGVPATNVAAVVLNVTVVSPQAAGYITVWPFGIDRTNTSNLNFQAGQNIPNTVIVPVGTGGKIQLFNGSGGTAHLLVDVTGYTLAGTPTDPGAVVSVTPARIADSRTNQQITGAVPALGTATVQVTGQGGVPAGNVAAVVLNVTVVSPQTAGYVTVWPFGIDRTNTSNLNFQAGQNIPNTVIVPVGAGGKIALFNGSYGTVHLVVDVTGYTLAGAVPGAVTAPTVTAATTTGLTLQWTNPTDPSVTGVMIRRAPGGTPPASPTAGALVADVPAPGSTRTDTGLTASTTYSYALFAHDAAGNYAAGSTATGATNHPLAISSTGLHEATAGLRYTEALTATGGTEPYTWTATGLPAGLSITTGGVISGSPTGTGASTVTVTVTDSEGATRTAGLTLSVVGSTPFPVAWGDRAYGQLGDGLTAIAAVPAAVDQTAFAAATPTMISASGGNAFSCAVAGGKAYCWGSNGTGQLGIGSSAGVLTPTAVSTAGVLADKVVSAVGTGTFDACAIAVGRAYCWGQGSKLGSVVPDRNAYYRTPLAVDTSGALAGTTVTAISVGRDQTCVIASGKAYCWGYLQSQVPVAMGDSGVLAGKTVTAITAGEEHACAIADGKAYCWGRDFDGQLGDGGSGTGEPVAVNTTGALAGRTVTSISAGAGQTCAVADGLAFCWGSYGALGDGVEDYHLNLTPTAVSTAGVLGGKTVTGISAAYRLTCAVADGRAYCWGDNSLGRGTEYDHSAVPVAVGGTLASATVSQISAGGAHACAMTATSKLYCWGSRQAGMLGDGYDYFAASPVATKSDGALAGHPVTAVAASGKHSCAIADQRAYCWGSNWYGGLGNNSTVDSAVPVAVTTSGVLNGKTVTAISAAGAYQVENPPETQTCVVASGHAYCWGNNLHGNLGNGSTAESSLIPVAVSTAGVLAGKTVTAVAVGDTHACAVADAKPYCWGDNTSGQLGNGTTNSGSSVPVAVTMTGLLAGKVVTAIATGDRHTCVIADSAPYCWGNNSNGELGNSSTTSSTVPVAVTKNAALAGLTLTGISAGSAHTCAIADTRAFCWGSNGSRQLGDGTSVSRNAPTAVLTSGAMSGATVTAISAGSFTTCAVASAQAFCWGADYQGSLGDGGATPASGPSAVDTSGVLAGRTVAAIAVGTQHVVAIAADPVVPPIATPGTS
jgi:alpha-tubulin suppressor-like RCC1 family protein